MGKSIRNLSTVTRVGLDLAKNAFQVHAVDATGAIVVARKLTRGRLVPFFAELAPCVVAMEACASAHHWGRRTRFSRTRDTCFEWNGAPFYGETQQRLAEPNGRASRSPGLVDGAEIEDMSQSRPGFHWGASCVRPVHAAAAHRASPSTESRSGAFIATARSVRPSTSDLTRVTVFPTRAVALPDNNAVTFRHYRPPPALNRGTCPACAAPVVAFMALAPLKVLAFVRSQNFERPSELPEPSLHIFYHRRVADATDALPKVSGYWASETAVSWMIFGGAFRAKRAA